MFVYLLACLFVLWHVASSAAADVTLAWEASTSPNIVDYRVYTRLPDGSTSTPISVGNVTTTVVRNVPASGTTTYGVTAVNSVGAESPLSNTVSVTPGVLPQSQLKVHSVDSASSGIGGAYPGTYAIDGTPETFWHTVYAPTVAPLPHTIVLDLGGDYAVEGLRYLPRQDAYKDGTIAGYTITLGSDGTTWGAPVATGTFAADQTEKTVRFPATMGRYLRLVATSEIQGKQMTSAAELNILIAPAPVSTGHWLLVVGAADVAWQYRDRIPSETQCRTIAQAKQQAETRPGAVWNCLEESKQNLVVTPKAP
jgi:F5/8 type C domain